MQNAFASKGGTLDIAGVDFSGAPRVVRAIRNLLDAARSAHVQIVYLQMAYKPDLSDSGGLQSPNCYREVALKLMRSKPELNGKLLIEGTWDTEISSSSRRATADSSGQI
jgi:ureidoacrylate peracid hydrolase